MEKRNPKVCVLGASFGTDNMGVNALTAGTVKAYFDRYPKGELFLLDYGEKGATCKFKFDTGFKLVQLVNIRFSKKVYLKNNIAFLMVLALFARYIPFFKIKKKIIAGNFCLKQVSEADVIVSIAGGDSFSDIYGMSRLLYVSLPQVLALIMGKKLVFLPQTIGPFKCAAAKMIARIILRKTKVIYSRDHEGLGVTKDLIGPGSYNGKIRFCYDVGFMVDPIKPKSMDLGDIPERESRNSPLVGLNVSGLLYMGGYTQNNMFGLKVDYRKLIYNVIQHLIIEKEH